jgi:hypothetical protein
MIVDEAGDDLAVWPSEAPLPPVGSMIFLDEGGVRLRVTLIESAIDKGGHAWIYIVVQRVYRKMVTR